VETRAWSVKLEPVPHEEGRFHAHSSGRKTCPQCRAKFTRKGDMDCPRCKLPLEPWLHLVDVRKEYRHCPCEDFVCRKRGEQEGGVATFCRHLAAGIWLHGFLISEMT
jgi:hypothetical protein